MMNITLENAIKQTSTTNVNVNKLLKKYKEQEVTLALLIRNSINSCSITNSQVEKVIQEYREDLHILYFIVSNISIYEMNQNQIDRFKKFSIQDLEQLEKVEFYHSIKEFFYRYPQYITRVNTYIENAKKAILNNIKLEQYLMNNINILEKINNVINDPFDFQGILENGYKLAQSSIKKNYGREPKKEIARNIFSIGFLQYGEKFTKIPIKYMIKTIQENQEEKKVFPIIKNMADSVMASYCNDLVAKFGYQDEDWEYYDFEEILKNDFYAVISIKTFDENKIRFFKKYSKEIEEQIIKIIIKMKLISEIEEIRNKELKIKLLKEITETTTKEEIKIKIKETKVEEIKNKIKYEIKKINKKTNINFYENIKENFNKETTHSHYDVRIMEGNEEKQVALGDLTHCCMHVGGVGESCLVAGIKEPKSGFLIWEKEGKTKAQAWIWIDENGGLVLDNIETANFVNDELVLRSLAAWAVEHKEYKNIQIGLGHSDTSLFRYKTVDQNEKLKMAFEYDGYTDANHRVWFKKDGIVKDYVPSIKVFGIKSKSELDQINSDEKYEEFVQDIIEEEEE